MAAYTCHFSAWDSLGYILRVCLKQNKNKQTRGWQGSSVGKDIENQLAGMHIHMHKCLHIHENTKNLKNKIWVEKPALYALCELG